MAPPNPRDATVPFSKSSPWVQKVVAHNDNDIATEKWPVWVRLVTIIGLSTGLWGAIIWAVVSLLI